MHIAPQRSEKQVCCSSTWKLENSREGCVKGVGLGGARENELEAEYFQSIGSRWLAILSWAKAIAWFDPSLEARLSYVRKALCNIQYLQYSVWEWGRTIESEVMKPQFL